MLEHMAADHARRCARNAAGSPLASATNGRPAVVACGSRARAYVSPAPRALTRAHLLVEWRRRPDVEDRAIGYDVAQLLEPLLVEVRAPRVTRPTRPAHPCKVMERSATQLGVNYTGYSDPRADAGCGAMSQAPMAWKPPSTWMISPVVAGNQSDRSATQALAIGSALRVSQPSGARSFHTSSNTS